MYFSQNKKYQYLYFFLLATISFINGGNSNILIQINFILWSVLFLYCLNNKNYYTHLKFFLSNNKKSIFLFIIFLLYILFQIIQFPPSILKFFSPEKYVYLNLLNSTHSTAISFSPSNTFFQFLNFISIFISLLIFKMIFYKRIHIVRFYFFLSLLGTFHSIFAVLLYLNGNPELLLLKNPYKDSATGFFVNRTVFSVFMMICFISSLEYMKIIDKKYKLSEDLFFSKIYIRIFTVFIAIAIITSFSKLGNFLMLITVLLYFLNNQFYSENKNRAFGYILLFIILFDILFMSYFFGSTKLVQRFAFLTEDFSLGDKNKISRLEIIKFGFFEIKNFLFFGYGLGGFENLFKLKFLQISNLFANHAHSSLIEFIGELGIIGFLILILSFIKIFFKKINYNFNFFILLTFTITILVFDFSLHIPINQILIASIFLLTINKNFFFSLYHQSG